MQETLPVTRSETTVHSAVQRETSRSAEPEVRLWSFWDKEAATARKIYLKILIGGSFITIITIFAVMSIFWGALWKAPERNLQGWVVVSSHSYLWSVEVVDLWLTGL